jgi:hypothetical protein
MEKAILFLFNYTYSGYIQRINNKYIIAQIMARLGIEPRLPEYSILHTRYSFY